MMGKKHGTLRVAPSGKARITIRLDDEVLAWFRKQVHAEGGAGYQTLINLSLRDYIAREPLEAILRRVIREELAPLTKGFGFRRGVSSLPR